MFVYVIVCNETLKIYVGQHKGTNLQKYLQQKFSHARHDISTNSRLYNALRKYSKETWSIFSLVSGIDSRAELDKLEQHYIRVLKTQHPDVGYNLCAGGEGRSSPWTLAMRMKLAGSARVVSEETRRKQSEAAKRRAATPEGRAHLSQVGRMSKPPRSEEHRKRLSESHLGYRPSDTQLWNQSLAQIGKPKPPRSAEHLRNNAIASTHGLWHVKWGRFDASCPLCFVVD